MITSELILWVAEQMANGLTIVEMELILDDEYIIK